MVCPNCKTELIEVNGRYICPDCGREVPENEIMAGDWGNSGIMRAGLYGAGTDDSSDIGNNSVAGFGTAAVTEDEALLPENDSVATKVMSDLEEAVPAPAPSVPEAAEAAPEVGFYTAAPETQASVSPPQPEPSQPVVTPEAPTVEQTEESSVVVQGLNSAQPAEPSVQPEILPTPEIVTPAAVSEIPQPAAPTSIPASAQVLETVAPAGPIPATAIPEHSDVVEDMFKSSENVMPSQTQLPSPEASAASVPMAVNKRANLAVIIAGTILLLLVIGGGSLAYLTLSAKNAAAPVVDNSNNLETAWQELQVVDGGFKIGFPGQPSKTDVAQMINGTENTLTNYAYEDDDIAYSVGYVVLDSATAAAITSNLQSSLPALVSEIANARSFSVSGVKIGTYYAANAVDFTLSNELASYQGKLMIKGNKYILVMAGGAAGESADYSKFIKSFNFISGSTTN